jgi:hypothetical protein
VKVHNLQKQINWEAGKWAWINEAWNRVTKRLKNSDFLWKNYPRGVISSRRPASSVPSFSSILHVRCSKQKAKIVLEHSKAGNTRMTHNQGG